MKTFKSLTTYVLLVVLCLSINLDVAAQQQVDIVEMLSGERKEGKVRAIHDQSISFVYSGEDLEYELEKTDIHKITFSSGREEIFTEKSAPIAPNQAVSSPSDRKNKMAILPFEVISNDPSFTNEHMSHKAQTDCANSFRDNTNGVIIQDPRMTNSLLEKNNINTQDLAATLPKDLALILGVEYVVFGSLDIQNEGTSTYGSGVTTYKDKEKKKSDGDKRNTENKGYAVSSGSSTTIINYDVHIRLDMYSDLGKNIYSDSKEPFGNGVEAYTSSLDYLVKRTPFGTKHK